MADFFESLPSILESAAKDPFSMIAFSLVIIAALALKFFSRENSKIKLIVFIVIVLGIGYLIYSLIKIYDSLDDLEDEAFSDISITDNKPKVVGIYPNDIFGINQKKGLIKSLSGYKNELEIINLDLLSYTQLKSDSLDILVDTLKSLLRNENIIAIAGPPITECSDDVLLLLDKLKSKVPIFLTTAAPKDFLDWENYCKRINLYRIGTGIDDRAESMAEFLKEHSSDIKKTAILVEKNMSSTETYGQIFLNKIAEESEEFVNYRDNGKISVFYYNREKTDNEDFSEYDSIFDIVKYDYNAIFLFGVGKPYLHTVNKYYKDSSNSQRIAKFGGYMFGYALNEELKKATSDIINNKIFEITDLNLDRTNGFDIPEHLNKFKHQFNSDLHPGLRDEASYYDIGICIHKSNQVLREKLDIPPSKYIKYDKIGLQYLNQILKLESFNGISSKIKFDQKGINEGSVLKTAVFDSVNNKWKRMDRNDIMNL